MDAILKQLQRKEAELTAKLQTRLTDYGRMIIALELVKVTKDLNNIYTQQLANIKRNGCTSN